MLSLRYIYVNDIELEKATLDRIASNSNDSTYVKNEIDSLWYLNRSFALYSFFVENNLDSTKTYFYLCGRIDEYLINKYNSRLLDVGVVNISYALLSDNLDLINRYADLTHPWYAYTIKSGSLVHAVQNIIKEDWASLEKDISIYERITSTQKGKINIPDLMYFKGMLNKDETAIMEALRLLLKDHKKRNKHMGIAQDYISIPALGYAKLAWLKGIEVEIDHPLMPKELLPYRSLEYYNDKYEFLKELL